MARVAWKVPAGRQSLTVGQDQARRRAPGMGIPVFALAKKPLAEIGTATNSGVAHNFRVTIAQTGFDLSNLEPAIRDTGAIGACALRLPLQRYQSLCVGDPNVAGTRSSCHSRLYSRPR